MFNITFAALAWPHTTATLQVVPVLHTCCGGMCSSLMLWYMQAFRNGIACAATDAAAIVVIREVDTALHMLGMLWSTGVDAGLVTASS